MSESLSVCLFVCVLHRDALTFMVWSRTESMLAVGTHKGNLLIYNHRSGRYTKTIHQRDWKWVVAYGLRGEGLVWLIGAVVCLLAAHRGSNCSQPMALYKCVLIDW